ncbi:ATP-binding cassette domain-containing protein, partial [bacterium M00.F.Ca.ET.229.01.1.1]
MSKRYGGIVALSDATFSARAGEVHALLGENGAGKSTLFNIITAIYTPTQGRLSFRGRDITGTAPHR